MQQLFVSFRQKEAVFLRSLWKQRQALSARSDAVSAEMQHLREAAATCDSKDVLVKSCVSGNFNMCLNMGLIGINDELMDSLSVGTFVTSIVT